MNKEIPNYILNKRKYNNQRYKENGYRGFSVNVSLEQFEEINSFLKEKGLSRLEFIKKIIEKYK